MSKYKNLIRVISFLLISSLLLSGCYKPYDPKDEEGKITSSRTFIIDDEPYPDKKAYNGISDKLVNKTYTLYVYIVTNGDKVKEDTAKDVKLTLVDETRSIAVDIDTTTIKSDGFTTFTNLSYPYEARAHLVVEGNIKKRNTSKYEYARFISNSFNIGNPYATVEYISVEPSTKTIRVGESVSYTAKAKYKDRLLVEDVTDKVKWNSLDSNIAIMNGKVATGMDIGETKIIASYQGKTAQASLTVKEPISKLKQIKITPTNAEVLVGKDKAFTAFGEYANGNVLNITGLVTWSSSNGSVAIIGSSGVATGVNVGSTAITATYDGISASANLLVKAPPTPLPDNERLIWEKEFVE